MTAPYFADESVTLYHGDSLAVLREMPDASVDCCVTSPPYFGLRDYGEAGQYGLEASPTEYVETMRALFAEVRRVLADDGTLWLNLGDSFVSKPPGNVRGVSDATGLHGGRTSDAYRDRLAAGHGSKSDTTKFGLPEKNLIGIPWRTALALQDDGWILRSDVIWWKASGMPESITDRPSRRHEHVFLFAKGPRYWFDLDPIREPHAETTVAAASRKRIPYAAPGQRPNTKTRGMHESGANPGDVWSVATQPFSEAHADRPAMGWEPLAFMHRVDVKPSWNGGGKALNYVGSTAQGTGHPTSKPLPMVKEWVRMFTDHGDIILDPCAGSGTTGRAAKDLGRRAVLWEEREDFCELIALRLSNTVRSAPDTLFGGVA